MQSSCAKPEVDIEGADTGHVQGLSQKKWKTVRSNDRERSIQERHQVGNRVMLPDDDSQGNVLVFMFFNDPLQFCGKVYANIMHILS